MMEENTMGTGKIIKCMARVSLHGQMGGNTLVLIKRT
jgi:hypothetical protein